ncbi:hypothetical protein CHU92_03970 [Flavobacterium cyanobacteriorum]|uniref:SIMPL domain-containing protein n=1 Tax=Flavobacterium cyanobacteriorum TaxID=2022802 RepID=A0A255ZM53_9FLAO|nr:SIMPL domain-containing protein [Flavobacterium cyanobacteriorum]OYQ42502.1 hypothetical protein CHU92_03970 [Flavobacterium cyanobacteriorum]
MKKIALVFFMLSAGIAGAQVANEKTIPQINVSGEGKVKVTPDRAVITIGVENTGNDAAEVKKKNDTAVDAIIKYLKANNIAAQDYQTQRVYLNRNYDYNKKKYNFVASQTIVITLKDLSKYDTLMMGMVDAGANTITGVEFRTSKLAQYESEARTKAVQQARLKANDYAAALGQKAGKAIVVTDNSQTYYPMMARNNNMMMEAKAADMQTETLAIGEIEITANVNVSFALE